MMRFTLFAIVLLIGHLAGRPVFAEENGSHEYRRSRQSMVSRQIEARDVTDPAVIRAMRRVPRHEFVAPSLRPFAYSDSPLPIRFGQTISQPYVVAYMTELAGLKPQDRVLEIGTGTGYQAAVLAEIVKEVYTIEIIEPLAVEAEERLKEMGYAVHVRHGDGYLGWPEAAPFDAIIVTAAPPRIPEALQNQLKVGGRLIVPVGSDLQSIYRITRMDSGFKHEKLLPVRFVPMIESVPE
jgi:protein-L-isoaspartate(D-aspartate) O-methyltransferase